jgi:uncharacterized membrane protein YoaT (DUF817 family)
MSEESALKIEERARLELDLPRNWPGFLLIGTGAVLLAANLFGFHLIDVLWPGFVVAPGLLLLWPAYSSTAERSAKAAFLAAPGAILLTVGLLLFAMNLTDHYEAWAYSWALLPAAAAAGVMYAKRFESESRIHVSGRKLIRVMVILFMSLAVFFEIVVFENFNPLLPLALIGYGVYLVARDRRKDS